MSSVALTHGFANVETYEFSTADALHFTANSLDNMVIGGSGEDFIDGGAGNDFLYGKDGNDHLTGGAGNDHLFGEGGADTLTGGAGDDTYFIDSQDTVVEGKNGGEDSVAANFSIAHLFANVEEAFLTEGDIDVHGNELNNVLYGSDGNNVIDGNIGNDKINGQGGNDTLIGGSGADTFMFDMVPAGLLKPVNDGSDTIKDFVKAQDLLEFDHVQDHNDDGKITLSDLFSSVTSVVDHGAGQSVDVTFENGSSISFAGAGTGAVDHLSDLVANAATQIHVS